MNKNKHQASSELTNVSPEQKKILLNFIKLHPELASELLLTTKKIQEITKKGDRRGWKKLFKKYKKATKKL